MDMFRIESAMAKPIPLYENTVEKKCITPTVDGGEQMISIVGLDPMIACDFTYHKWLVRGAERECYMRLTVYHKLQQAVRLLGDGYGFLIYDALRSVETQQALYDKQYAIVQKEHPALHADELAAITQEFVASPQIDYAFPSTHMTGGAVDLTLTYGGEPLNMGTGFDDFTDKAHTSYFEDAVTPEEILIRNNRRLLYQVMLEVGFTNYRSEWWHFDYGDRGWGAETGQVPFYPFSPLALL